MALPAQPYWRRLFKWILLEPTLKGKHLRSVLMYVGIVLVCCVLNTVTFYFAERSQGRDYTLFDAVWFSATSITTVGYGDLSPQTVVGRIGTMVLMYMIGVACLPVAVAHLFAYFEIVRELEATGMSENKKDDCLIIVHFPNAHWVKALIEEVRADPLHEAIPVWVVDPLLERLPEPLASMPGVHFVHGNTIDLDTYRRANAGQAKFIVVLPREPHLSDTDASTSTVVRVIRQISDARIIPVRVDSKNDHLFEGVRGLVPGDFPMKVAAQELTDPFVARGMDSLLSNREGSFPLSVEIQLLAGRTIADFEALLRDFCGSESTEGDLRLLAHVHAGEPDWLPKPQTPLAEGDVMIVVGSHRPSKWKTLEEELMEIDRARGQ